MKKQVEIIEATPSKRIFLSIIADYNLNRSICELVDNALDVWIRNKKKGTIAVRLVLDQTQQTISVEDNAGGLQKADLRYIVGPGQTGTVPTDETIGIFGVGTKRAVVALAQEIKVRTRYSKGGTFQIDLDDGWLNDDDDDWGLPVYEVDEIGQGTTIVDLQRLRIHLDDEGISHLRGHLGATYARFLKSNAIDLTLNGETILPQFFEEWAYPPNYGPKKYTGVLKIEEGREVRVEALAGLTRESSPAAGEYGVYFYCNDRLTARALKTFDVGFARGFAGLPHPKVSLTRVLVSLNGDARSMPWNSSKSEINTNHAVFVALRNWLVDVVTHYASLSRIWMGDWPDKVFKYKDGTIKEEVVVDFPTAKRSFLPPLPKSRPRYGDVIAQKNKNVAQRKPWTRGLYEGVIAADLIFKQHLDQKNRITLIVLDSTLEIAFKDYLVNESGIFYTDSQLLSIFGKRHLVHLEMKKYVTIAPDVWKRIEHFYQLRCKLVHERATVGISDAQIAAFRKDVEGVLKKLFNLKFDKK